MTETDKAFHARMTSFEWFLEHGQGRRRRSLPISPGYGAEDEWQNKYKPEKAMALAAEEAVELAEGIGENVELWRRDDNGKRRIGEARFDVFKGGVVFIPTATEIQGRE